MISRRHFLIGYATGAMPGCGGFPPVQSADATPFNLGIASGDPSSNGVVLWTRICPDGNPFAFHREAILVNWVVAEDPLLTRNPIRGSVIARPENAHCVHVELEELAPDRYYYYQFEALNQLSITGRTRTLPAPLATTDSFKIALTSCQDYSTGYFSVYDDIIAQEPAFILHCGDYIYESAAMDFRPYPFQEAFSLEDYRLLYALYRQDQHLRAAHAQFPWILIWDDHEVVNDWGAEHFIPSPYNRDPAPVDFITRKKAAVQAFFEHMPICSHRRGKADTPNLYHQLVIGNLAELNLLDVRSYRDRPVCAESDSGRFTPCSALENNDRHYLGSEQEAWLLRSFAQSNCRWNVLAQTTVMTAFNLSQADSRAYETDGWDNYPPARDRLLRQWAQNDVRNIVSLGGNIHAFYGGGLAFDNQGCEKPMGTEIITTSLSAGGGDDVRYRAVNDARHNNPCLEFFDNRVRGYALIEFAFDSVNTWFRVVDSIQHSQPHYSTLKQLVIESGRTGFS